MVGAGLYLFLGNVSGMHLTLHYAGFFTMTLGLILIVAGIGKKDRQPPQRW